MSLHLRDIGIASTSSRLKDISIKTHSGKTIVLKDGMKNFEATPRAYPSRRSSYVDINAHRSSKVPDVPNFSRPFTEFFKRKSFYDQAISAMKHRGFDHEDAEEDDLIQIGPTTMSMGWPYKFQRGDIAVALFNGVWRKVRVRSVGVATDSMLDDALFHDPDYEKLFKQHEKFIRTYQHLGSKRRGGNTDSTAKRSTEATTEDDSDSGVADSLATTDEGLLWYRASWRTSEGKFFAWFSPLTGRIKPYNAYIRDIAKSEGVEIVIHRQ